MKGKDVSINYTDKNGKEVIISQNGETGGIMVTSKAEKDYTVPFGKSVKKGEWVAEYTSFGGKKAIHYDEAGLIFWYETEYQKFRKHYSQEALDSFFGVTEGE